MKRRSLLLEIKGLGNNEEARKLWKKLKGYHRGSLAETGLYRFIPSVTQKLAFRLKRKPLRLSNRKIVHITNIDLLRLLNPEALAQLIANL